MPPAKKAIFVSGAFPAEQRRWNMMKCVILSVVLSMVGLADRGLAGDDKPAWTGDRLIYTETYTSGRQVCTGKDQLLIAREPWIKKPIMIRGIGLAHRVFPPTEEDLAMAGSSATPGDILLLISGSKSETVMFEQREGFLFPPAPSEEHIDVHSWCKRGSLQEIWIVIYYTKTLRFEGNDGVPEPADRVPNDASAKMCQRHSEYCLK
jgi:hypothetical protein